MNRVNLSQISLALGLTATSAAAMIGVLAVIGPDWSRFAPASCTASGCFCEAPRAGALLLQPVNSLSSLGFVMVGWIVIGLARGTARTAPFDPLAMMIFGISAIVVGLGSMLLHATLTLWGQFADVFGMYLLSAFMLVRAIERWRGWPTSRALRVYALLCAALTAILIALPEVRRWLFAMVLLLAIIIELAFARHRRAGVEISYYASGIAINGLAFAIWNLDQHHILCSPESVFQGHAAWHLLGAAALWCSFFYYRSEQPPVARQ